MKRLILTAVAAVIACSLGGCGLVFQGLHQELPIATEPSGAHVSFQGEKGISPTTVTVSRRPLGYFVLRAEKEGYHPGCRIVNCATPKWIKVFDSIPAAIPLLIDLAAGSLAKGDARSVTLGAMSADSVPFSLPSDEQLLQIFSVGVDACKYAYLYDPEFVKTAERLVVTTGAFDLQRRFEELGPVDFNVAGSDITSAVSVEWVRGFSTTTVTRKVSMATPSEMNELLRRQALRLYGKRVDAVINVTYGANPKNDVSATGLAVHFLGEAEAQGSAHRLEELESMRAKGLISEDEFQSLRAKVLRDLAE